MDAESSQAPTQGPPAESRPGEPASKPKSPGGLSNLALRLLTAAVLIPPVLWVTYAGGLPFVLVILGISCVGLPYDRVRKSMRVFADKVIPRFK